MEITSVSKYKGSTFEVELDHERRIYLHADIIADYAIHSGMQLERDELRKMIYASNFRRAYQYSLYQLDYRDYSEKEMTQKLIDIYKNEHLCRAVVEKLKSFGAIDDERYAEKLARKYVEIKKFGYRRAKREMLQKGLDGFTAEDALEKYSESFDEGIAELIGKKYARYLTDENDKRSVERVKSALARYGYSYDEINRGIKKYFEETEN